MKNKRLPYRFLVVLSLVQLLALIMHAQITCAVNINQSQVINPASKRLLGVSFDGRSSMDYNAGPGVDPAGYFDPTTGILLPAMETIWNRMPFRGVRYPGNLEIFNWNWSYTVGPFDSRIAQPMGPNGTNSQALQFGFDEFMDTMNISKGLPSENIQIMVNLYPSVGQPDPAILAADWVEYCNAPHNGTNPRGGTNWAMLRYLYGHSSPYGIKIWNIGNEPWQAGELGNSVAGANNFINLAIPIIDSMLEVDPTLHITVPAVGPSTSNWNSTLLNSSALMSRIYGFSSHAFYDEDPGTGNPNINQVGILLAELAAAANAKGKKVFSGDHASNAPAGDPDKAMRWEGALATANMLTMLSQISNIELANFWIYGNVKAVWHPIRQNVGGTYTFMAAAQIYEQFDSVFYDKSLATTISNVVGGGVVPNVRAAAFQSNDGSKSSLIVVNIDLSLDNVVIPPTLPGFNLHQVKIITAPGIYYDTCSTSIVGPLGNGNYSLPKASVLVFEFQSAVLPVAFIEPILAYPDWEGLRIEWATASEVNSSHFEIERSNISGNFTKIGQISARGNSSMQQEYYYKDKNPNHGLNYYRIKLQDNDGRFQYSKIVSARYRKSEVTIYPNPVKDYIYFQIQPRLEEKSYIKIFNSSGQAVIEKKWEQFEESNLDISNLPKGLYFFHLLTGNGLHHGRFISI